MAPNNPIDAEQITLISQDARAGSVISDMKNTLRSTKAKLTALHSRQDKKIIKLSSKNKPTTERERLKQTIERLSKTASSNASSSSDSTIITAHDSVPKSLPRLQPSPRLQDFEVGGTLGRGKFGRVYLARHLTTNFVCALKIISKSECMGSEEERLIRREVEVHQNLAHKNILKLLSWFHDDHSIYLVLEYAPGGSLYSRLKKQPKCRFNEHSAAQYIAQMAEALGYMHSKNVMHRDIKPENILLGFYNEIKLADFGYSVHSASGFRSTVCGTLDYLSPEVAMMLVKPNMTLEYYTKAIDQWSLGVLAYELLISKPPFEMRSSQGTQKKIANFKGKGLRFPSHVSKPAEELIRGLLNLEAEKRISFNDVLIHPWIVAHVDNAGKSGDT